MKRKNEIERRFQRYWWRVFENGVLKHPNRIINKFNRARTRAYNLRASVAAQQRKSPE